MPKTGESQSLYLGAGSSSHDADAAVPDRYWLAFLILYLLGIGSLLPWNALITPTAYFQLRLTGSPFITSFESILSVSFTFCSFAWVIAAQWLQHIIPIRVIIIGSLLLLLAALSTLTVLAIIPLFASDDDLLDELASGATSQFIALIVCGMMCGTGQAFLTVMTYSYAAVYQRPNYMQAISGGQGVAGLSVTLANALLKIPGTVHKCAGGGESDDDAMTASRARDLVTAASVYFAASCVVIMGCIGGFLALERLPFTRARQRMASAPLPDVSSATDASLAPDGVDIVNVSSTLGSTLDGASGGGHAGGGRAGRLPQGDEPGGGASLASQSTREAIDAIVGGGSEVTGLAGTLHMIGLLWKWCLSIWLVYVVTIAIFPSLTVTIVAEGGSCAWQDLFGPLGFVLFNLGDTIGRNLPCLLSSTTTILTAVGSRLAFAPFFMLCYTGSGDAAGPLQLPTFAGTDALPLGLMLFFSMSNGWLTSSVMVSSQREGVMPATRRQQGATLLVLFLNTGIFVGAALSFLVRFLNCTPSDANGHDCNPFLTPATNSSR